MERGIRDVEKGFHISCNSIIFNTFFVCFGYFFLMKKQQWNKLSRHLDGILAPYTFPIVALETRCLCSAQESRQQRGVRGFASLSAAPDWRGLGRGLHPTPSDVE